MLSPADAAVVRRDAALPGLAVLLDPDALADKLHPMGFEIEAIQTTYTRYKPGTNCLVAYRAKTSEGDIDFYDKQIFIDTQDQVGLLDFDTLATGEAALDLANALVHFELRALLGRCSAEKAAAASQAMFDGYQPNAAVYRRLKSYADATRLRLACVYTFRPHGIPILTDLLAKIGQPIPS